MTHLDPNSITTLHRLSATHNPTGTSPSFLLPVFDAVPKRNALYLQTLASDASTVASFEVLANQLKLQETTTVLDVRVGEPAVFAFEIKNQMLFGTRSQLVSKLMQFTDDPTLLALPILRLEVVDFCNLVAQRKEAAALAYQYLSSVSRFSADYWRDRTYLTSRARRIMRRYLESLGEDDIKPSWWESTTLRLSRDQPTLTLSYGLGELLAAKAPKGWRATLANELSDYVRAFGNDLRQLEFDIQRPSSDQERRDNIIGQARAARPQKDLRWLVFAFGRAAANASRQIGGTSHYAIGADPPSDKHGESFVDDAIREVANLQRNHQGAIEELPMVLVVVDATSQHVRAALSFVRRLPKHSEAHCIVLYRTREGIANLPKEDDLAQLAERVAGVTVVSDNDIPLGESLSSTSLRASLSSLAPLLASQRQKSASRVPKGMSLFGMGWTRAGVRGYQQAVLRSIAAATNPWLSISKARNGSAILHSVGRPPDTFGEDVDQLFNEIVKSEPHERIRMNAVWRQRRFVPNANVAAKFEFIAELGHEKIPRQLKGRFADAARTILSAQGFSVSNLEGERDLVLKAKGKAGTIEIFVPDENSTRGQGLTPHILLMQSRAEQQAFLKLSGKLAAIYPLLLGDLFFLNGERGPLWSAQVLAYRSYPRGRWQSVLKPFLEGVILNDVKENPRRHFNIDRMPKRTSISSVEVTITQTERLPGRRITAYGSMFINFDGNSRIKSIARSPGTHERMFTATLGPNEFRVE